MFATFATAWKLPDIRKKLLFTFMIIILFRIGCVIPVPFVDAAGLKSAFTEATNGTFFEYMNILSGDAFSRATLFALSISPYITASIIVQLLTIAIPALERMSKDENGKKKLNQITRYTTVALALLTSYGYYAYLRTLTASATGLDHNVLYNNGWFVAVVIISSHCACAALIMWLAEKINENGIGNGISIILFANIIASAYTLAQSIIEKAKTDFGGAILYGAVLIIILVLLITFVIFITNSERRLPVQYAKRVVGRKMYGGRSTFLPIKLNMSGVMPIIFASSIVSLPSTVSALFGKTGSYTWASAETFGQKLIWFFSTNSPFYPVFLFLLIIGFSYFYLAISFNPVEVANNLKNNGGSIPGIRPGKPTSDFITKILSRITFLGALFLGIIAILPFVLNLFMTLPKGLSFGGTSLLIVVGVALETVRELESQITMRHYKGFLE